jgi:hypothetical protein
LKYTRAKGGSASMCGRISTGIVARAASAQNFARLPSDRDQQ